jgi:hypothetical protein
MGFKFYFVNTFHTIVWLEETLYQNGFARNNSFFKVITSKNGKETSKTMAFVDEAFYDFCIQNPRDDFKIAPFKTPSSFHPSPHHTYNYCIPFHNIVVEEKTISNEINHKLQPFVSEGLLTRNSYKINIPVKSRINNELLGLAFVIFNDDVDKDLIANIRYVLDNTLWSHLTEFRCFWGKAKFELFY